MARRSPVKVIGSRIVQALPVILLATFMVFALLKLVPGDIAVTLAGDNATDARITEIRKIYGLDRPFLVQYGAWLGHVAQGDLSQSLLTGEKVAVSIGRDEKVTAPLVRVTDGTTPLGNDKSAFVVVAKVRSVEALTAAIEAGASGYFVVPIDFLSLSATICSAAVQARDLSTMSERTAKLHESLTADQTVSTVVGILMERYRFQRNEAYERLRRYSRTERRKVVEVAAEIVTATEELGKTMRAIESVAREPQ